MTTIWQFLRSLVHNSHGANLATIAPNRFSADEDQAYSDVTGINTVVKTLSKWLVTWGRLIQFLSFRRERRVHVVFE